MRRSPERDRLHLMHMRDAAQLAQQFVANRKREDLDSDRIFQLGLAKALELVGESASHISDELQAQQTQIPWKKSLECGTYWYTTIGGLNWTWFGKRRKRTFPL